MVAECAVSNPTLCVRFSKNSEVVAFGTTGGFQIWETNTQQKKLEHNSDAVLDVEFVDHRLAIAGPTQLVNHDLQSGERIGVPLLIGSSGGWNSGPHLRRLIQCDEKNGRLVAVGGGNVAQVVDTRSGAALNQPLSHFDQINHIGLSSNGRFLVSASDDRTAKIWKVEAGELRCQPLVHDARVMYAGFSVDSHYVFTTSDDATARLWDAETGEPVTPPLAHRMRVRQAILSADNTRLITCTLDGAFQWRVPQPTRRLDSAIDWAQVCAARRLTSSGQLAPLSTSELTEKISRLRERATSISATAVTENSQGSTINGDVLSDR
jgi:WD40 repeat protein